MKKEAQIIFRGLSNSDALAELCHEHIARLETIYSRLTNCRVTLAEPNHAHGTASRGQGPSGKGHRYEVTIDLTMPGNEIIVRHTSSIENPPLGITSDLHQAFSKAKTQLETHLSKKRRVKDAH